MESLVILVTYLWKPGIKNCCLKVTLSWEVVLWWSTHCMPCGILVPWPGIEPRPSVVGVQSPNHWIAREFPWKSLLKHNLIKRSHIKVQIGLRRGGRPKNKSQTCLRWRGREPETKLLRLWILGRRSFPFFFFLAVPWGLWDLSSLTRDLAQALSSESLVSKPLGHQGAP